MLGKRRFEPEYTEIEVTSHVFTYQAFTPWNERQSLRYLVCDLRALATKERMAVQVAKARADKFAGDIAGLLKTEYEAAMRGDGVWQGLTKNRIVQGVTGTAANVRTALDEMVKAGTIQTRKDGNHATAKTFFWLPGQILTEDSAKESRRSTDEATPKGGNPDQPSWCVRGVGGTSSSLREPTNDEAPVPGGAQGAAFEFPKTDEAPDEAPTKPTKLDGEREKNPPPMAKNSPSQGASAGSWGEIQ